MSREIPCPFCHTWHHRAVIQENGYTGVKCPTCEVIYISPRPNQEDIRALYAGARRPRSDPAAGAAAKRRKAMHTLGLIRPFLAGPEVLEIGPGAGSFLEVLRREGFHVCGIELNGYLADYLNHTLKIPCDTEPLSPSSFGGRRFDLIYHADVLSHFFDPVAEFAAMHAKLRDRGLVVFETGNLAEVQPRWHSCYPTFKYPEHLYFFGGKSLRRLLAATGFELIALHRYSLEWALWLERFYHTLKKAGSSPRTVAQCAPNPIRAASGRSLKGRFRKTLRGWLDWAVDYFVPYRLGATLCRPRAGHPQTLIVVARKAAPGLLPP